MNDHLITAGLVSGQKQLGRAMRNATNAETKGYHKVTSHMVSSALGHNSSTVDISPVMRSENQALFNRVCENHTLLEGLRAYQGTLQNLEDAVGRVGDEGDTLAGRMTEFQSVLARPQMTQDRGAYFKEVVNKADLLAKGFRDMSREVQKCRSEADKGIEVALSEIQSLIYQYHDANQGIMRLKPGTEEFYLMRDKRDQAFLELSSYMPVQETRPENDPRGCYLSGPDGMTLVTPKRPNSFSFNSSGSLGPEDLLENGHVQRVKLHFDDLTFDVTENLSSSKGKLGALLETRDEHLPAIQDMLDRGAAVFADKLNHLHNQGTCYGGVDIMESSRLIDPTLSWSKTGTLRAVVLDGAGKVLEKNDIDLGAVTNIEDFLTQLETIGIGHRWSDGKLVLHTAQRLGQSAGMAFAGLSDDAKDLLTDLGLNDLFHSKVYHKAELDTVTVGFAFDMAVNPRLLKNPLQFAHGKLNEDPMLYETHTGVQYSDGRNLDDLGFVQQQDWTFKPAGVWDQPQTLKAKDWGRLFDTHIAQEAGTANDLLEAMEEKVDALDESYQDVVGVDPFENRMQQMKWREYVQHMMVMLGIQQDLENTFVSVLSRTLG